MKRLLLIGFMALAAVVFAVLGLWQLERRTWKLDLINRVEARIHAAPAPFPPPTEWPALTAQTAEYRRVRIKGVFRHDRPTFVAALTERGAGYWVMTPLDTPEGPILINRGFVPQDRRQDYARPQGKQVVTGLLRMSEPGGGFLRPNRPQENLWYSRDVGAIARSLGFKHMAPVFVDAEARSSYPVGGLTVVNFRNAHMAYALTWWFLAFSSAWAAFWVSRK